ncbi:DUF4832 domain-containing protein [Photobacterium phosphoreum]|uniref:DUF4832 domain-containing protein n=3 Tax=Photobacterium phosphoreum TaxID=659 RepID=A0A2T3JW17_PHOPO|nr:DUF4832 domain-containing protein [Photobacterium phosphoreum]PSU53491.1 DUF4832 domain-containing protein [Photobacterium phosphoreum]
MLVFHMNYNRLIIINLICASMPVLANTKPITLNYTPTINNNILVNPDIGITDHQTINRHNNPYWAEPSYPKTSVAYYRWYWEQLEPQKGIYNYKIIDDTIKAARAQNKKLVIRFMTMPGLNETYYKHSPRAGKKILGIPCWLKKQIDPQTHAFCKNDNSFIINYKNKVFKDNLKRFVDAMGKRYDHNPTILRLDVGLVGTWGEWHLATHYKNPAPTLGNHGYKAADLIPYITMMQHAFPDKMLTMSIGTTSDSTTSYATQHGLGWRADCIGDWTPGWNHMLDGYPQTIKHLEGKGNIKNSYPDKDFLNRWQHAPVDLEICTDMLDWKKQPKTYTLAKVKKTFDVILTLHTSLFNLKSSKIPAEYQPLLDSLIKKLGYRFNLNHVEVISDFKPNSKITFNSQWQNMGVAPSYNNYPIVWRLRSINSKQKYYFYANNNITQWMPASSIISKAPLYNIRNVFTLPKNIIPGKYYIDVAMVKPHSNQPQILLGINGEINNKWFQLIKIKINH